MEGQEGVMVVTACPRQAVKLLPAEIREVRLLILSNGCVLEGDALYDETKQG